MEIKLNDILWTCQPIIADYGYGLLPPRQVKIIKIHKGDKPSYNCVKLNCINVKKSVCDFFGEIFCHPNELFKSEYEALNHYRNYLVENIDNSNQELEEITNRINSMETVLE